jgi:hypothetical protein
MLVSTLVSAVALFTASANGLPRPGSTVYTPASDLSKLATMMPQSDLPAPDGQLKYVVLGVGTQNYTCTTGDPNAAPGTTGAVGKAHSLLVKYAMLTICSLPLRHRHLTQQRSLGQDEDWFHLPSCACPQLPPPDLPVVPQDARLQPARRYPRVQASQRQRHAYLCL